VLLPGPYFERDVKALAVTQAAAAVISIAASTVLIMRLGLLGAGLGLVTGAAAQALLQLRRNRRKAYLDVAYDGRAILRFGLLYLIVAAVMLLERDLSLPQELMLSAAAVVVVVPAVLGVLGGAERRRVFALAGRALARLRPTPAG